MRPNPLQIKSYEFSLDAIRFCVGLQKANREFIISKQLLRSATSIGANIMESQDACSKKDFVYKLQISLREARESLYWLRLIDESGIFVFTKTDYQHLIEKCDELIRLLVASVKTIKNNMRVS